MAERRADDPPAPPRPGPRTAARLAVVQALYQVAMTDHPACRVVEEFVAHRLREPEQNGGYGPADEALFRSLTVGTAAQLATVDRMISETLAEDWRLERLETTLLAILRAGVHELVAHPETPAAVVISEYVDVAHAFNGGRAAGLVNGVLDRIARDARGDPHDRPDGRPGPAPDR